MQSAPSLDASRSVPQTRISAVVAIPVRNERDRIADCLSALLNQTGWPANALGILLFLNNCTDDTRSVVEAFAKGAACPIRVLEEDSSTASAGWARKRAMDAAADWLTADGTGDPVILTTDADSRVPADWIAGNMFAIMAGADAVAGRIMLDVEDAAKLPASLHARGRLEARYEELLTELGARLDPETGNPWPCHWSKSGATIAVRLAAYRAIGGLPDLPLGEDRALIDAIRARDMVVRHARDIVVTTSGRLDGRAVGGVADTMRLRCERPDAFCDDRLERLGRSLTRVLWRRRLRKLYETGAFAATWRWAPLLGIRSDQAATIADMPYCGQALSAVEAASPRLVFRPVRPAELPKQIRRAQWVLRIIRALEPRALAAHRAGNPAFVPDGALSSPSTP
jgi:hypothetical protein